MVRLVKRTMFKINLSNGRKALQPDTATSGRWESEKTNLLAKRKQGKTVAPRHHHIRTLLAITLASLVLFNVLGTLEMVPVNALTTPTGPITINGNAGFTRANGVISGLGTASSPYIIEGWEINLAQYSLNAFAGVTVQNTNAYFIMRNFNIHDGYRDANFWQLDGIRLYNVQNGVIANSTISRNSIGISLTDSKTNKIAGNTVADNVVGIAMTRSSYNIVSSNTVSRTPTLLARNIGFVLVSSSGNSLTSNAATGYGIGFHLQEGSSNTLTLNKAYSNQLSGFDVHWSTGNKLDSNIAYSNGNYGFLIESSSGQTLVSNIAYSNALAGFYVQMSSNNVLSFNKAYGNMYAGAFQPGHDVGHGAGFAFLGSEKNTATSNTAFDNDAGFALAVSSRNRLSYNTVHDNFEGFYMSTRSNLNVLTQNQVYHNTVLGGFHLSSSSSNTFTHNSVYDNTHGFFIEDSENETLTSNSVFDNKLSAVYGSGIYMWQSTKSNINSNLIYNNPVGILENGNALWGGGHTIYNNFLSNPQNVEAWWANTWSIQKTAGTNIIGGPYLGGNFWSDYTGKDNDGDGLGDTQMTIRMPQPFGFGIGADYQPLVIPTTGPTADFKLLAISGSVTLAKGTNTTIMIALASHNGYTGTVILTATISPSIAGAPIASMSPAIVTLSAGKTSASTLYLTRTLVTGTYTITVHASGAVSRSIAITLTVK